MDGTVVSRKDIYKDENEDVGPKKEEAADYPQLSFTFEEIRPESPAPEGEASDAEPEALEFQLFGGSGPVNVNLAEQEEEVRQERPSSFYIYSPSHAERARAIAAAVSGKFVLEEAEALRRLAARNPLAEDINASWRVVKKRCRPGKEARLKKRLRNERIEAERKAEAEQWKQRRRAYKPRGPATRRPKTGFTFK